MSQLASSSSDDYRARRPILPDPPPSNYTPNPAEISVPGLDTNASAFEQCDQLDQMITRKLQNIDANIAKANEVLATRLLPAFKKFALATEPVREAADFWLSFYEKAAAIRIPTEYEDASSVENYYAEDRSQEDVPDDADMTAQHHPPPQDPSSGNVTSTSESSFMPSAAVSSTPARAAGRRAEPSDMTDNSNAPWSASIDSPLERLSREIAALEAEDNDIPPPPRSLASLGRSQPEAPRNEAIDNSVDQSADQSASGMTDDSILGEPTLKQYQHVKAQPSPLLRGVLTGTSAKKRMRSRSPRRLPGLKAQNPFARPDTQWNGLVDVRGSADAGGSKPVFSRPGRPGARAPSGEEDTARLPLIRPRVEPTPILPSPHKGAAQRSTADVLRNLIAHDGKGKAPSSRAVPSPRRYRAGMPPTENSGSAAGLTPPTVSGKYARMWNKQVRGEESSMGSTLTSPSITGRYGTVGGADDGEDSPLPALPDASKYARYMDGYSKSSIESSGRERSVSPSPGPTSAAGRYAQHRQPIYTEDTVTTELDLPPVSRYTHPRLVDDTAGESMQLDPSVTARWAPAVGRREGSRAPSVQSFADEQESAASLRDMMRDVGLEIPGFGREDDRGGVEDDSFGETMRPEQMALFARGGGDDSFGSEGSSGSSFGDVDPRAQLQFAPVEDAFDDSFEEEERMGRGQGEEETVFGLLPARRQTASSGLHLHGQAVLDDTGTLGYGVAPVTSPTPRPR